MKYQGIVIDRMGVMDVRKTRKYETYKDAHDSAERLCEKTMGERGELDVVEVEE